MRVPRGTTALVRQYLAQFDRRFLRTDEGVLYRADDRSAPVHLSLDEAASLIAGMRAALVEADGGQRWSFARIWPLLVAAPMVLAMAGAITDRVEAAAALVLPVEVAILLLGPGLGLMRVEFAWRRGLAAAARQLAGHEAAAHHAFPVNPLRMPFFIVAAFAGAIVAGLFLASIGASPLVAARIDALLGRLLMPIVLLVVGLGWAAAIVEARRPRVSEAEIAEARVARRNHPLG